MAQNYTQKAFINGKWVDMHPETAAPQVITDAQHRFLTDAQITAFEGKQDALGYTPENTVNKNKAGGYAGLDDAGRLPLALIPALLEHNKGYFAAMAAAAGKASVTVSDTAPENPVEGDFWFDTSTT